jgi:putative addiction module component (TIGR02574 family)
MKEIRISDVLELSVPERMRLVQAIWDSIEAVPEAVPVTEAEREELDRRLEAYYQDPDVGSPWSEVKARILRDA